MNDKILSMAGLARRAHKVSAGAFAGAQSVKNGGARLVIIASDASDNTKKQFADLCSFRKVPIIEYSDTEALGKCTGTATRAVISVNDKNFAKAISDIYNQSFGECRKGDE